jgi:hypothetical protein
MKTSHHAAYFDVTVQVGNTGGWSVRRNIFMPTPIAPLGSISVSPYIMGQLGAEARMALEPAYSSGFSATNAVFELKDFKGLTRHVQGVGQFLKAETARKFGSAIFSTADNAISSIASAAKLRARNLSSKTLAELTLEYDFAFKPLVNDVAKLSILRERYADSLERFNAQGSSRNTFHFSKELPQIISHDIGLSTNGNYYGSVISQRVKFHAQVGQTWTHSVDNRLDQFLQHYGLQLSPKNIWDAIPFSFIVDILFSVGKSLEAISRNTVTHRVIHNYSESLKTEYVVQRVFRPRYRSSTGTIKTVRRFSGGENAGLDLKGAYPVAYSIGSTYNRTPMELVSGGGAIYLPAWNGPRLNNVVDALAMVRTAWGFKGNSRSLFNGPHD